MEIKKLVVGFLETNCYILYNNDGCLVVDPGADYEQIKAAIADYNLEGILVTHYHFDHVGALNQLIRDYCVNVFNFKTLGLQKTKNFSFEVMLNKGHKEDCVSFIFDEAIFTGDFIFKEGIGRVDMPGGSHQEMEKSLEEFKKISQNYLLYPGHGPDTTLQYERENNPYLK